MKAEAPVRPGVLPVTIMILGAFMGGFFWACRRPDREPKVPPVAVTVAPLSQQVDFRWERERERSRLKEELERMLETAGGDLKAQIEKELWELTLRGNVEKEVESLLAARGYRESTVVIHPQTVTVVIKGRNLTPAEAAAIGQLTAEVTGFPLDKIRIVE